MDYNITTVIENRAEDLTEQQLDDLIEQFAEYHVAIGSTLTGETELVMTLPADSHAQATKTALAVTAPLNVVSLEVMTTKAWLKRSKSQPVPELLSVSQVAERDGLTRQAVLARIDAGTLPARRVGSTWAIPSM